MLATFTPAKAFEDLEGEKSTMGVEGGVAEVGLDDEGNFSQAKWAMASTVSSIAVKEADSELDDEISAEDNAEMLRINELAKKAALTTEVADGDDEVASECSDMSDVSDIFPSVGIGAVGSDSEEDD